MTDLIPLVFYETRKIQEQKPGSITDTGTSSIAFFVKRQSISADRRDYFADESCWTVEQELVKEVVVP